MLPLWPCMGDSVLLWRRCDMLCASSCVDHVVFMMFSHNSPYSASCVCSQWFHEDLRSLWNTNRKSYLASQTQPSICCFDDRKCPKSCSLPFVIGFYSLTYGVPDDRNYRIDFNQIFLSDYTPRTVLIVGCVVSTLS